MWCVLPPMVGMSIILFFWVFAMLDRMSGAPKPRSSVGIVTWFFVAGVMLALSHACLPHESRCAEPASGAFFALLGFALGSEYRREEHAPRGYEEMAAGIACAVAVGVPVACSALLRELGQRYWVSFVVLPMIFRQCTGG